MNKPPNRPPHNTGFMLIEIALVIVVLAIILGPIVHLLAGQQHKNRTTQDLASKQKIVEAVEGFVLATGRLPCPALQAGGQESRTGDACTRAEGWLPNSTLSTWGLSGNWKMAVATLESAGEPAQNTLVSIHPFAQLSPQQLAEIVMAPFTINHGVGAGPLPAIHLCQSIAGQTPPANTEPGCGAHTLLSPTAVWVAYPVTTNNGTNHSNLNQNRFQQFFIDPEQAAQNPVWISFERMNWLWMKRGALDPIAYSGELN
jgi:type II secretory pathway pseudopilin PulG